MKIILIAVYPLLVAARLLQSLLGRDPLHLKKPKGDSCWIAREAEPAQQDYFSEQSQAEGRLHGGLGWLAAAPLRAIAHWYAPGAQSVGEVYTPAADREEGIPDEVYTLW